VQTRICTLSLTLVGTRFYLSRSRETRCELREKQMEVSALLIGTCGVVTVASHRFAVLWQF